MDGGGQRHPPARELLRVDQHLVRVECVGDEQEERVAISVEFAGVDWIDSRAVALREAMDAETSAMYREFIEALSDEQIAAVDEALAIDPAEMVSTILAIRDGEAVGHAALRPYHDELEVKKVFVSTDARGEGISRLLMLELERIAMARGVASLVLQTGPLQVPAIRLYESLGYERIPPYGKYGVIENALCYRKFL